MNTNIPYPPRSPFTTRFSGTVRENKERMRNIFDGGRKHPGRWLFVLSTLVTLFCCFYLVSCQRQEPSPSLVMDTQYYDVNGNYIEIPVLTMPDGAQSNEGVTAINQALAELKAFYQPVLEGRTAGSDLMNMENRCLLYPTETDRYLNLIFLRDEYHTDLNTGHIASLVYDKEKGTQITLNQALALAGQTEEGMCQALADQYDPGLVEEYPDTNICIQNQALEGFRMGENGQPVFYLTARVDDRDDTVQDTISGADSLYIWSGGSFARYDQYAVTGLQPLVPAAECLNLNPPLWRQWFFDGGEPEGGFTTPASLREQALLGVLYQEVSAQMDFALGETASELLYAYSQNGYTLGAASFRNTNAVYLAIGVLEDDTGVLTGPAYIRTGQGGAPHAAAFQQNGNAYLLYTFNRMEQGSVSGEAGVVGLDGEQLSWFWPVYGDVRMQGSKAQADYDSFWRDHLGLMSASGLELLDRNTDVTIGTETPRWVYHEDIHGWSAPEQELPGGVYGQTRAWLEELSQGGQIGTIPWQIISLTPANGNYLLSVYSRDYTGEADYLLTARSDMEVDLWLTARLTFDHGERRMTQVVEWHVGSSQELGLGTENTTYPLPLADGRTITLEFDEAPIDDLENTVLVRQVKVWDSDCLLQTITAGNVWEDGIHSFEGLYRLTGANKVPGAPDLRDLNGDGSADLGLLVNSTFSHNVNYAYFLWDDQEERLTYSGLFFATLEVESTGQVVETEYTSNQPDIRRRYKFTSHGSDLGYGVPRLMGLEARGNFPPEEEALPIPAEGISFSFASGAGAWSTELALFPDGTFSGEYQDSDMGDNTIYLCRFRGAFSMFTPLDDHTWSLTLTDLEMTTGHPVDEEWMEGDIRYVASIPYGLDGGNEFFLYLPGTPAAFIPERCRSWNGGSYGPYNPGTTLSGYSLCNLRAGYGFFT